MRKQIFAFLFIAHCLMFIANCYAQQPTQEWVARYPDSSGVYAVGNTVKLDSVGNVYIMLTGTYVFGYVKYSPNGVLLTRTSYNPAGYSNTPLAFDVTKKGEVFITGTSSLSFVSYTRTVKYDTGGSLEWSYLYTGDNGNECSDIKVDKNDNAIVVGGSIISGNNYALVIKFGQNGDTLWTRHFNSGQGYGALEKVVLDDTGNLYATGAIGENPPQCLVLKYSPNGSLLWSSSYSAPPNLSNDGRGILLDQLNSVYVIGVSGVPSGLTRNYLLKYTVNGTFMWSNIFNGILVSYQGSCNSPLGPVVSNDGSSIYYLTSVYDSSRYQLATIKCSNAGDTQWVRTFASPVAGQSNSPGYIAIDRSGSVYICGTCYFQQTHGDYTTIKYSSAGIQQWMATYSGLYNYSNDYARSVIVDSNNNVYVTGESDNLNNTHDAVTIKFNQPVGIVNQGVEFPTSYRLFQNYPNPFNSSTVISYELPKKSDIKLVLYDVRGMLVKTIVNSTQPPSNYSIVIDMGNYASGIYFYSLFVDGKQFNTKKLILIK